MRGFKEGDRVRIVVRDVLAEDRRTNRYFDHMAGITGTVQNVYGPEDIAVKADPETLTAIATDVHREAVRRLREKFLSSVSEEAKQKLTPEELSFTSHYMLLVRSEDLEKIA